VWSKCLFVTTALSACGFFHISTVLFKERKRSKKKETAATVLPSFAYLSLLSIPIRSAFGIGAIISPILGGALLSVYKSWQMPLVFFGALGFVAIASSF
jgi:MFS family permease